MNLSKLGRSTLESSTPQKIGQLMTNRYFDDSIIGYLFTALVDNIQCDQNSIWLLTSFIGVEQIEQFHLVSIGTDRVAPFKVHRNK